MRRAFQRAAMGTQGIFFISSVAVVGLSALAWGLWSAGGGVGSVGLMSIDTRPAAAVTPPAGPMRSAYDVMTEADTTTMRPATPAVEDFQIESEKEVVHQVGPVFDGRALRPARQMEMKVTAYSPDEQSCGEWADGWTASGYSVWTNGMRLVAADTALLPFGTIVTIPGYNNGEPVQVLDIGGAIKGSRLDVLYPTHERARQWGVQQLEVTVWEYAD